MSKVSKINKSRNHWKVKASVRGNEIRYLRKRLESIKKVRNRLRKELKEIKKFKENLPTCKPPIIQDKHDLVLLAIQLIQVARIGFRAASRVLGVLVDYLGIKRAPCPQTIINWSIKLSIVRTQSFSPVAELPRSRISNGWIYMIDASIGLGTGKILSVLALRADYHKHASGAPGFADVRCVAVAVANSWTGTSIADFLKRVIAVTGRPVAYLKDRAADLLRAIRLLADEGLSSPMIDDISHAVANLLKWRYQDNPMLQTFLSACSQVSANLKQTPLACLVPPRVQTKARFMNLHRLITWADHLLKHSPPGRAPKGSMLAKLRECLGFLTSCKPLIQRFKDDVTPLLECQQILKTSGLNNQTMAQCESLIQAIPANPLRQEFGAYLETQLDTARGIGLDDIGIPISSDPIESLFGLGKILGAGQIKDADRIALRLPALCGIPTREEARQVLGVSDAEYREILDPLTSLTKQRRNVLPNPNQLESLINSQAHVELIPSPKNRSNNGNIHFIPDVYTKAHGTQVFIQEGFG